MGNRPRHTLLASKQWHTTSPTSRHPSCLAPAKRHRHLAVLCSARAAAMERSAVAPPDGGRDPPAAVGAAERPGPPKPLDRRPDLNMAVNARAERLLGVEADSLVYDSYFITDQFTYNLRRWSRCAAGGMGAALSRVPLGVPAIPAVSLLLQPRSAQPGVAVHFPAGRAAHVAGLGQAGLLLDLWLRRPHASGDAAAGRAELLHGVRFARRRLRLRRRAGGRPISPPSPPRPTPCSPWAT